MSVSKTSLGDSHALVCGMTHSFVLMITFPQLHLPLSNLSRHQASQAIEVTLCKVVIPDSTRQGLPDMRARTVRLGQCQAKCLVRLTPGRSGLYPFTLVTWLMYSSHHSTENHHRWASGLLQLLVAHPMHVT